MNDLPSWLKANQLNDAVSKIGSAMTLEGLLSLEEQKLRSILGIYGLNNDQINRLVEALTQENSKSQPTDTDSNNFDYKTSDDDDNDADIKDGYDFVNNDFENDGEYPVLPVIIPNNCIYDPNTGKIKVNHHQSRDKLVPYKPALEFIRNISSKVATISIVGRARTGKSLVAGELYAPGKVPCPFDLGHLMDACTYGIWVSAKTIKHPYEKDTVVLIFDVEGTGFHQANQHNDMQLMVITLLISSYFIYNSKGTFDAPALDEIKFVTELTETIQATPDDDSGEDFKKFFPIFMWLLRDVHLIPVINDKKVSIREYFTQKVLSKEKGFNQKIQNRQWIRAVFLQMFQKYDAFTLPMPHAKPQILKKIGILPRNQLMKTFVDGLSDFCDKVMKETTCKILFSKKQNGEDDYIQCTGSHLATWIEQCIEAVNDPNKIPEISSMTEAVMANVYRDAKQRTIEEYKILLTNGLNKLRNNNDKQPLDKQEIIDLHLRIFDTVLNSTGKSLQIADLKDEYKNNNISVLNQQQIKVFHEFCDEIGHDISHVKNIGSKGILFKILSINMNLSYEYCKEWLNQQFDIHIEPLLQNPKNEAKIVMGKMEELEKIFFMQCKGEAKEECWKQFKSERMEESMKQFKKLKGFNIQLIQVGEEAATQREQARVLQEEIEEQKAESAQQRQLMQAQIDRADVLRKDQEREFKKQMTAAEQRAKDMQQTGFTDMVKAMQQSQMQMTENMMKMQTENSKATQQMTMNMMNAMKELANRPPPKPVIIREPSGGCFGGSNKCYRKKSEFGEIEICAVSEVELGDWMLTEKGIFSCTIHIEHSNIIMNMVCIKYENINKNKFGNIIMTDHHYIYIIQNEINELKCISAGQIKIGDKLKYICQGNEEIVKVINISKCTDYASSIMTTNGNIIISNILSSCFTTNTINLKKYLWIGQILVDYVPIKYAQIISNCFYYTNKYSKYIVKKYNKYFSYN